MGGRDRGDAVDDEALRGGLEARPAGVRRSVVPGAAPPAPTVRTIVSDFVAPSSSVTVSW